MKLTEKQLLVKIKLLVLFFIGALVVSGITAFPLETELGLACFILNIDIGISSTEYTGLQGFIASIYEGIMETKANYPFIMYGTDWLAFAHIIIAVLFIGVYIKPVRNIWIVYWAMIACVGILPLAFICGAMRGIPFYWQLVDCSFGIFGMIPLLLLRHYIQKLQVISCYTPLVLGYKY